MIGVADDARRAAAGRHAAGGNSSSEKAEMRAAASGSTAETGLGRQTFVAEIATAAAIAQILKLKQDAVGVGEVELRCAAFGAAALGHSQAHVMHERPRRCVAACGQAVVREHRENSIDVEVAHIEATMVDVRGDGRSRAGPAYMTN